MATQTIAAAAAAYEALPELIKRKLNLNGNQESIGCSIYNGGDLLAMRTQAGVIHKLRIGLKRYAPTYKGGSWFVRVHYSKQPVGGQQEEVSLTNYDISAEAAQLFNQALAAYNA